MLGIKFPMQYFTTLLDFSVAPKLWCHDIRANEHDIGLKGSWCQDIANSRHKFGLGHLMSQHNLVGVVTSMIVALGFFTSTIGLDL